MPANGRWDLIRHLKVKDVFVKTIPNSPQNFEVRHPCYVIQITNEAGVQSKLVVDS